MPDLCKKISINGIDEQAVSVANAKPATFRTDRSESRMKSRRQGLRRRRRTDSTLRSQRRANDNLQSKLDREGAPQGGGRRPSQDAALIWNWNKASGAKSCRKAKMRGAL